MARVGAALLPGIFFLFYFGLVTYSLEIRGEKTREEPKECGRAFCTGSGVGNANDKRAGSPGSSGSHQCSGRLLVPSSPGPSLAHSSEQLLRLFSPLPGFAVRPHHSQEMISPPALGRGPGHHSKLTPSGP